MQGRNIVADALIASLWVDWPLDGTAYFIPACMESLRNREL